MTNSINLFFGSPLSCKLLRGAAETVRLLLQVMLPGIFLGVLLTLTMAVLRNASGLAGIPGAAPAIMALELVVGACLVGYWREKHSIRDITLLPVILLAVYAFRPEPLVALVAGGLCTGGALASLPRYGGFLSRAGFAVGFGVGACLVAFGIGGGGLLLLLFPAVFAVAVWYVPVRLWVKSLLFLLLPVVVWCYANHFIGELHPRTAPARLSVAPALPASLLAEPAGDGVRILFVSGRPSPLPSVWGALPYVESIDCVTAFVGSGQGDISFKFNYHTGLPGRELAALTGTFDLVFLADLPSGSMAARRNFCRLAWARLSPGRGVLVLPAADRELLPTGAHIVILPGSGRLYLAASDSGALSADVEVLDRRLLALQEGLGKDAVFMPLGIFSALYFDEKMTEPRPVAAVEPLAEPENFRLGIFMFLGGYLLLRFYFGRLGRVAGGMALVENAAGFMLILLAAGYALGERELETGTPALLIWALFGISFLQIPLRLPAERWFCRLAWAAPLTWLWSGHLLFFEPGWLLVPLAAALAAGMTVRRITLETGFPRSWVVAFTGFGLAAGGAAFAALALPTPFPFWPAVGIGMFLTSLRLLRI